MHKSDCCAHCCNGWLKPPRDRLWIEVSVKEANPQRQLVGLGNMQSGFDKVGAKHAKSARGSVCWRLFTTCLSVGCSRFGLQTGMTWTRILNMPQPQASGMQTVIDSFELTIMYSNVLLMPLALFVGGPKSVIVLMWLFECQGKKTGVFHCCACAGGGPHTRQSTSRCASSECWWFPSSGLHRQLAALESNSFRKQFGDSSST